jgi:hypothetical protein
MAALYNRFSLRGARDSVNDTLKIAASPEKISYICREWQASLLIWANYVREHSALLLQVSGRTTHVILSLTFASDYD